METKETPRLQNTPITSNEPDVFGLNPPKEPSQQKDFFDPFTVQNTRNLSKQNATQKVFEDDLLGHKPAEVYNDPFGMDLQGKKVTAKKTSNQDDLDIFFGTSNNAPTPTPAPAQPAQFQNRPSDIGQTNKNDVSGFTVYNQLNNSNMKDMSAMGINNFLDINQEAPKEEAGTPKFNLREEPSGTIFDDDNGQNTNK